MVDPKMTITVWSTGKIALNGAKTMEDVKKVSKSKKSDGLSLISLPTIM